MINSNYVQKSNFSVCLNKETRHNKASLFLQYLLDKANALKNLLYSLKKFNIFLSILILLMLTIAPPIDVYSQPSNSKTSIQSSDNDEDEDDDDEDDDEIFGRDFFPPFVISVLTNTVNIPNATDSTYYYEYEEEMNFTIE